jgi:hypothetical protein
MHSDGGRIFSTNGKHENAIYDGVTEANAPYVFLKKSRFANHVTMIVFDDKKYKATVLESFSDVGHVRNLGKNILRLDDLFKSLHDVELGYTPKSLNCHFVSVRKNVQKLLNQQMFAHLTDAGISNSNGRLTLCFKTPLAYSAL